MAYRWLLRYLYCASLVLAPALAQAAGLAPDAGRITTSAPRGPDATQFAALLTAFEAYAEQARVMWGTPGMAVAIVHEDKLIYAKGFGVKKLGGTDPVDPHTLFPIGSTSKAFTSALVALLADEGKLRSEDPVVDHVPAFEMSDPWVTRAFMIEDLMAQHSGMSPYAGDLLAVIGFDAPAIQAQIKRMPLVSSFRSRFSYVNNLFLVAAEVIRRHTGMPWAEAVQRRLFEPLGMTESSTSLEAYRSATNMAFSHAALDGQVTAFPMDAPALGFAYTYGPAGGVNSTVLDVAKWLRLHLAQGMFEGTRLISEANLQVVHSPKTVLESQAQNPLAHTTLGSMASFYCEGWLYSAAHPYPVIWHVYGDLVIEVAGDTLALTVGPRRVRMALRHWNRDTFLVSWPENDAYPGASRFATFAIDPKGQPVGLTLDLFADVDKGLFVRVEPSRTPSPRACRTPAAPQEEESGFQHPEGMQEPCAQHQSEHQQPRQIDISAWNACASTNPSWMCCKNCRGSDTTGGVT